ncbi:MAG: DUF2254 domain-containing protein [Myxococcota bacterium]|nr:DUF2254 domain-containing protein [Myxococcota bacterium]
MAVLVAIGGAIALIQLDRGLAQRRVDWFLFDGGPESARELLSTITSAMLTFTALVFSITILVLQLASNQFSPRVIRTFLREPVTKWAMSMFVGTFVYSMVVLSQVRTIEPNFVPAVATWAALLLVVASVAIFIWYIHRMAQSVRAIAVISTIAAETRTAIERVFPEQLGQAAPVEAPIPIHPLEHVIAHTAPPGVVAFIDADQLMVVAQRFDAVVEIIPSIGAFVPTGAPLFRVWGQIDDECCRAAIGIEIERTIQQDPAFGFRQLVDVAVRALSPGVNDPTTAVQVLDHLHDLVRRLVVREFPARTRADGAGELRIIAARPEFIDFVRLAFEEIGIYGADSIQVRRRLGVILADCGALASPGRRRDLQSVLGDVRSQPPTDELYTPVDAGSSFAPNTERGQ